MRAIAAALAIVVYQSSGSVRLQPDPSPHQISNSGAGAYEVSLTRIRGGFAAAWYDTRAGRPEIYARLLDDQGQPAGRELRLTDESEAAYEADIAAAGDDLAVAWYERTGGGTSAARLALWGRDGDRHWTKTLSAEGRSGRNPVVRANADEIFCAWLESARDGATEVWAGWFNFDGRPLAPSQQVAPAGRTTWNLNSTIDARGDGWIVFDATAGTRSDELFGARVDKTSSQVSRLTTDDGSPSKYPDLVFGENRAALTWYDERDGNKEVYLLVGALGEIKEGVERRARRVTRTRGESIGAYVAWNGLRFGLSWSDDTEGQHEVYFQAFDPAGKPRHQPRRLTHNPTSSLIPAIRPARDGFALAWNEYTPPPRGVHQMGGRSEIVFSLVRDSTSSSRREPAERR